jgi:AcrR family transcriptional regulator
MNTKPVKQKRNYDSALRAEQVVQTRNRIMEAVAEQMVEGGMTDFSIERVAQRAGVSTRTIYHHFPNRDELMDAVLVWIDEQSAINGPREDATGEDLVALIPQITEVFDEHEVLIRAMLITELGRAIRERGRSKRRPTIEAAVRRTAPQASEAAVNRAASVIHFLLSSEAWRSMKDESGLTGTQAGEAIAWAVERLLDALRNDAGQSSTTEDKGNGGI